MHWVCPLKKTVLDVEYEPISMNNSSVAGMGAYSSKKRKTTVTKLNSCTSIWTNNIIDDQA